MGIDREVGARFGQHERSQQRQVALPFGARHALEWDAGARVHVADWSVIATPTRAWRSILLQLPTPLALV